LRYPFSFSDTRSDTSPTVQAGFTEFRESHIMNTEMSKGYSMLPETELSGLKACLSKHHREGKVLLAMLYGSYAHGTPHGRSDIDLALYLAASEEGDDTHIIDEILMSADRQISILRLDDEDESPFVVQEALRGIHLVEPDTEALYRVYHRVLHEGEAIRARRETRLESE
jgi:predicted nucleotidyltransferase